MLRALAASIAATLILSLFVSVNASLGMVPQLDLLSDIASFNDRLGLASDARGIWATHVAVGVVIYGLAYAALEPVLPGRGAIQGMLFGTLAWLAMMVAFMPLAGRALFARDLGPDVAVGLFAVHLGYGLVLGVTYDRVRARRA